LTFFISAVEKKAFRMNFLPCSEEELKDIFDLMDVRKEGMVDLEDFEALLVSSGKCLLVYLICFGLDWLVVRADFDRGDHDRKQKTGQS